MSKIVYVVDDDRIYQFAIKWHIQKVAPGAQIVQFTDASSCLDKLQQLAAEGSDLPEVMLLDINMPETDGWQFIGKLREMGVPTDDTAIYMVSSSIDPRDIERARLIPEVKSYVIKPVSEEALKNMLWPRD